MSLTLDVAKELCAVHAAKAAEQNAELASMIRFGGVLDVSPNVAGEARITVDVPTVEVAERVVKLMTLVSETARPEILPASALASRGAMRYEVIAEHGARDIIQKTGLVTRGGDLVIGLPRAIVAGQVPVHEAVWRGAFLVAGHITEPDRASSLEVTVPCMEAGLALAGCGRKLGAVAKVKESRTGCRVTVRDGDAIGAVLTRMGAHGARLRWNMERLQREASSSARRLDNFDDANLRRSAQAAAAAAARAQRAMEILGDEVPEHLAEAGNLRVAHQQASLEELGRLAEPVLTKDAIAGRIRRLLSMADKRAAELGIPDTQKAEQQPESD